MKIAQLVTTLACLLALGGCLTLPQPVADSDGSVNDHPGSDGQVVPGVGGTGGEGVAAGVGGGVIAGEGGGGEGVTGGVGGGVIGGEGGGAFGTGGNPASADPNLSDGGVGVACLDGTSNPCTPGSATDASFGGTGGSAAMASDLQLGTRSAGCERVPDEDLCMGEGWMLAEGESIPACGESGAYRICTLETDTCVSHTVMMVQRCE